MIAHTAYDIIRSVTVANDHARPPRRDYHHTFGDEPAPTLDHPGGSGGGNALWRRIRGAARVLGALRPARAACPAPPVRQIQSPGMAMVARTDGTLGATGRAMIGRRVAVSDRPC